MSARITMAPCHRNQRGEGKEDMANIFISMASASCVIIFSEVTDSSVVEKQCKEKRNYFARFLLLCLHDPESTRLSFSDK